MVEHTVCLHVPEDADSEHAGETIELAVPSDSSILHAARQHGLWLPADCQQGWCTTCAARLREGEVDQSDARRYFPVDEEAGLILTCVAKPRSDLDVETHQHDEMVLHRAKHGLPPGSAKRGGDG